MKRVEVVEAISYARGGIKVKSELDIWISPHPLLKDTWKELIKDIKNNDEVEIDTNMIGERKYYTNIKLLKKSERIEVKPIEKNWDKIKEENKILEDVKFMNMCRLNAINNSYLLVNCLIENKIIVPKDIGDVSRLILTEKNRIFKELTGMEWK